MRKLPKRDELAQQHRASMADRWLGKQRECTGCPESRTPALERKTNPRLCTECRKTAEGKNIMEQHHIAGRANSEITISIRANDHRARLSEDQRDWPPETLRNPDGSPLLAAAACIRGFTDTLLYLAEQFLLWVAELLERLHAHLVEKHGPKWWANTEIEKVEHKRGKENV